MKTTIYITIIVGLFSIPMGCSTLARNPEQDIVGVWEITKFENLLRRSYVGSFNNRKIIFHSDGRLFEMAPDETDLAAVDENNNYTYSIDRNTLVMTSQGNRESLTFRLRGHNLIVTDPEGEVTHLKRRSTDLTNIPVWEERDVPVSFR